MASNNTGRFQWPIPPWNADWQKWQAQFNNFAAGVDATVFAILEHVTVLPRELPVATLTVTGPTSVLFSCSGPARFISRTMQSEISVDGRLTITDADIGALVCADLQPGAVGPQAVLWELHTGSTPIDPTIVPFGVVFDDLSIYWYNGNRLSVGVPTRLFADTGGGTGPAFMAGIGNPNGVVPAAAGTSYHDTAAGIIYMNVDSATTWIVT
jgi:hypothetical protein